MQDIKDMLMMMCGMIMVMGTLCVLGAGLIYLIAGPENFGGVQSEGKIAQVRQVIAASAVARHASSIDISDEDRSSYSSLDWVNYYRARAGVDHVASNVRLNRAAQNHAQYVIDNQHLYGGRGMSMHDESYHVGTSTGAHFWERMQYAGYQGIPSREVIAHQTNPESAVAHWMETVYHRFPIISPCAAEIGYGYATAYQDMINVVDIGEKQECFDNSVALWPPDGAQDVSIDWDGLESPQPPQPPQGFPSGPVISMTTSRPLLRITYSNIIDLDSDEVSLPHIKVSAENDRTMKDEASVAIYGFKPFQAGHRYQVTIHAAGEDFTIEKTWKFQTRHATTCNLIEQDCPIGQACYIKGYKPMCAWKGTAAEGEVCVYQNDCVKGATCVNFTCKAFCSRGSHTNSCDECPNGYRRVGGNDHSLICR